LLSAIHAIPASKAAQPESVSHSNPSIITYFEQATVNVILIINVVLFLIVIYKIASLINKRFCTFKIQPDLNYQGYLAEIYVELFDNIDYVKLKVCSVRHHASNLMLSCHEKPVISTYNRGYVMDNLILDYLGALITCKSANTNFGIPVFISIPMYERFVLRKMIKRSGDMKIIKTRLIAISNGLVYDLLRDVYKTNYYQHAMTQTDVNIVIDELDSTYATMN